MSAGRFARAAFAVVIAATAPVVAAHAAGDVGVINHLAGLVTVTNGANTSRAQAYMNIHVGDRFEVPEGVVVKVAYFQGGRQEWFSGPASFTIGTSQSIVRRGSNPQVSVLPSGVPQKISQTPDLVQIARLGTSAGSPSAREQRLTPAQQAEVREAREIYVKLRSETPADDITPELYLYSVLQDHLLYADMKGLVAEMAKRQPGNRDVGALADYIRLKTEPK